jgi:hypothetical protein
MKTGMGTRFSNLKDFALSLATVWFYLGSWMTPLHAMDTTEEVYHYKEVTGDSVKEVAWRLRKGETYVLTYTSPAEQHVTTTGHDYDTRRWQVTVENEHTHFSAERIDQSIIIRGVFKGEPVDKQLAIDEYPWYQATSLSLRGLITSGDSERVFWTIRMDTLTAHKIRAVKKDVESVEFDGRQKALLRIRLSLPGMLAPFWKSDYWFALPEGVFYRFKGPSGPPGSPTTLVTRAAR